MHCLSLSIIYIQFSALSNTVSKQFTWRIWLRDSVRFSLTREHISRRKRPISSRFVLPRTFNRNIALAELHSSRIRLTVQWMVGQTEVHRGRQPQLESVQSEKARSLDPFPSLFSIVIIYLHCIITFLSKLVHTYGTAAGNKHFLLGISKNRQ